MHTKADLWQTKLELLIKDAMTSLKKNNRITPAKCPSPNHSCTTINREH
jgi:hypothetical protein